jgi:hypothetical protein
MKLVSVGRTNPVTNAPYGGGAYEPILWLDRDSYPSEGKIACRGLPSARMLQST